MPVNQIHYSDKYYDDTFEYRHVILPSDIAQNLPKHRLLTETEWRALGVQQSRGWVHYGASRVWNICLLFALVCSCEPGMRSQGYSSRSRTSC